VGGGRGGELNCVCVRAVRACTRRRYIRGRPLKVGGGFGDEVGMWLERELRVGLFVYKACWLASAVDRERHARLLGLHLSSMEFLISLGQGGTTSDG
jgi:hypothetical protein